MASDRDIVLDVQDLEVTFRTPEGSVRAVDGVSFSVRRGETLAVVGESGSGKSATMLAVLQLLPRSKDVTVSGHVYLAGHDLLNTNRKTLRGVRGKDVAMIFQDPATSLNPVMRVGRQISEVLLAHGYSGGRKAASERAVDLLRLVGIPEPETRAQQYPHQFSGGMRQRVMIAMGIANEPSLLIADEPTTALDVTIQAQVLDVLDRAKKAVGAAAIIVTHDLGVVAEVADRVLVMYGGRIVESGTAEKLFSRPCHPYTVGLMASVPRLDADLERLATIPGAPPDMTDPPPGCRFHPRCGLSQGRELCRAADPRLRPVGDGHGSACHFAEETSVEMARLSSLVHANDHGGGR